MLLTRAFPPGPAVTPEDRYTKLELAQLAGAERPHVVCNFVASADGKATTNGRTAGLTGGPDREIFLLLRTQVDALLAGTGTLAIERYGLPIRSPRLRQIRIDEGRAPQPLAVVISRTGDVPFDIPLFEDPAVHVALYAPAATVVPAVAARVTHHALQAADRVAHAGDHAVRAGDDALVVEDGALPAEDGALHADDGALHADDGVLHAVMASLRRDHGVRSLLCEGGPVLFNSLLRERLIDELFLTVSPMLVGGGELGVTAGPPSAEAMPMQLLWALLCDGSLFLRYSRRGD